MGSPQFPVLPVDARLDTSKPSSDIQQGELVDASDCAHLWWGPRRASAHAGIPSSGGLQALTMTGAENYVFNTSWISASRGSQQSVIDPTAPFTVDLVLLRTAGALLADPVPIFRLGMRTTPSANSLFQITYRGDAAGVDLGKIRVIMGNSSPVTIDHTAAMTTHALNPGLYRDHIRLVSEGTSLTTVYLNGTAVVSTSTWAASESGGGPMYLGTAAAATSFIGRVYSITIRDGADHNLVDAGRACFFPKAENVRFAYIGSTAADLAANPCRIRDVSRWRAIGTPVIAATASGTALVPKDLPALPVNGMGVFTSKQGQTFNAVSRGGEVYFVRVS